MSAYQRTGRYDCVRSESNPRVRMHPTSVLCAVLHCVITGQVVVVSNQFDGVSAFNRLALVYEQVAHNHAPVPASTSTHSMCIRSC